MSTIKKELIAVAVNWWAEKISNNHPHSNGDNSLSSVMACMMADMASKPISLERLELFKTKLTVLLEDIYQENFIKRNGYPYSLGCDYGPDITLGTAAEAAGIELNNFPFKTHMHIYKNKVMVSDGYAQPFEIIFEAKEV